MLRTSRPPRFKYDANLAIYWGSVIMQARVIDVSVEGLFLDTATPLWVGATFSADLMLQPPLRMNCTVRRIEPNRGMAVQIAFPSREIGKRFADLLAELSRAS